MIYVYTDSASSISIAGKRLILSTKNSDTNDTDIKSEVQYFLVFFVNLSILDTLRPIKIEILSFPNSHMHRN